MAILLKQTFQYRLANENEASQFIEETRANAVGKPYTVAKAGYTLKNKKAKGEIIDEWAIVDITLNYEEG